MIYVILKEKLNSPYTPHVVGSTCQSALWAERQIPLLAKYAQNTLLSNPSSSCRFHPTRMLTTVGGIPTHQPSILDMARRDKIMLVKYYTKSENRLLVVTYVCH